MAQPQQHQKIIKGNIYRIRSRNLRYAIYDGAGGFIGIREKFGERYLDVEFLGPAPGTVNVIDDLGPSGLRYLDSDSEIFHALGLAEERMG